MTFWIWAIIVFLLAAWAFAAWYELEKETARRLALEVEAEKLCDVLQRERERRIEAEAEDARLRHVIQCETEKRIEAENKIDELKDIIEVQDAIIEDQNTTLCRLRGTDGDLYFELPDTIRARWTIRSERWN